ncbi:21203_t:CDS:2, partial [Cetraspora pellucida]
MAIDSLEQPDELSIEQHDELSIKQPNKSPVEQNVNNDMSSLETLFKHMFMNAKLICLTSIEVPYFSCYLYPD